MDAAAIEGLFKDILELIEDAALRTKVVDAWVIGCKRHHGPNQI